MTERHKWYKEIQAWSEGAEIEIYMHDKWTDIDTPQWHQDNEYRIKPQPVEVVASGQPFRFKEKKYLYVYEKNGNFFVYNESPIGAPAHWQYFGKIEVQND